MVTRNECSNCRTLRLIPRNVFKIRTKKCSEKQTFAFDGSSVSRSINRCLYGAPWQGIISKKENPKAKVVILVLRHYCRLIQEKLILCLLGLVSSVFSGSALPSGFVCKGSNLNYTSKYYIEKNVNRTLIARFIRTSTKNPWFGK